MQTLENLALVNGVLAAVLIHNGSVETVVSPLSTMLSKDKWQELFVTLSFVLDKAKAMNEDEVRMVAGEYTMTGRRVGDVFLGVATPVGHPVMKSLHRTMTRSVKMLTKIMPVTTRPSPDLSI